jgi:hypothetical protein
LETNAWFEQTSVSVESGAQVVVLDDPPGLPSARAETE